MPGKEGMRKKPAHNTARQKMWTTIRIKRRFDIRDLLMTVPGAKEDNARRLLLQLEREGHIAKLPGHVKGRVGSFQGYRLVRDDGPRCPVKSPSPLERRMAREEKNHDATGSHGAAAAHD